MILITDRTTFCDDCRDWKATSLAHGLVCNCGISQDGWFTPHTNLE